MSPQEVPPPAVPLKPRYYFAYGSNLSSTQMAARCPHSAFHAIGFLRGWSWIINGRGYANIVQDLETGIATSQPNGLGQPGTKKDAQAPVAESSSVPAGSDGVWGAIYALGDGDEDLLDGYEGVPFAYTKEVHAVAVPVDAASSSKGSGSSTITAQGTPVPEYGVVEALVYVDRLRAVWGPPKQEYVSRIKRGVEEAVGAGMSAAWGEAMVRSMMEAFSGEGGGEGEPGLIGWKWLRRQKVRLLGYVTMEALWKCVERLSFNSSSIHQHNMAPTRGIGGRMSGM